MKKLNIFQFIKTKLKKTIYNTCQIEQMLSMLHQIDRLDVQSFIISNVSSHTILICEFFKVHGECLPSYVKYFLTLGYNVHVVIDVYNYILGTFAKCNFPKDRVKIFIVDKHLLYNDLFYKKIIRYQYIVFATNFFWENYLSFFEHKYVKAYNKNNFYWIEHHLHQYYEHQEKHICDKEYFERHLLLIRVNPIHPWVIPLYFYDNVLVKKTKGNVTNFLSVGRIEKQTRNYDLLFDVIRELINRNIRNFKVTVVGYWGDLSVFNLQELDEYIDIRGTLSYDAMYECVEHADFLLSLLDFSNEESKKNYIQNVQTSGTNNLSIGFQTPCLYNEHFGKSFGFSDSNALLYSDNSLLEAMLKAMKMSDAEYQFLQKNLLQMKLGLEADSLKNLENIFGKL